MLWNGCLLLLNLLPFVVSLKHEKPVSAKVWDQRCKKNSLVLNDCNWCWCNKNYKYTCNARVCEEVDMFGHFNDAIQDIDVGMEGHGAWRSAPTACEPGVHYSRDDLLCVCAEDGNWPNPVCRDIFRVLHSVQVIKNFQLSQQQICTPTTLYLADCNVCFCPSTGRIDPNLCTKTICNDNDFITTKSVETQTDEVYAECNINQKYKLGCKNCICLRNNRLLCDNCTKDSKCEGRAPGETFNVDCNTCHCDSNGYAYCTFNKCHKEPGLLTFNSDDRALRKLVNELDCEPGTRFKKNCNTCYCFRTKGGIKKYACTLKKCFNGVSTYNCKLGESYTKKCRSCQCKIFNGEKMEICKGFPRCLKERDALRYEGKKIYKQECEPRKIYKSDCNICECAINGDTLICTDNSCDSPESIAIDIIPVAFNTPSCKKGYTFKIDCNFCICLDNGNNLCTTMDCNSLK